jgi:hypothetical protein
MSEHRPGCTGWKNCECFPTRKDCEIERLTADLASERTARAEAERERDEARQCAETEASLRRDALAKASAAGRAWLVGAPHGDPAECPTFYDGCRCYVATLAHNIERASAAERALSAAEQRTTCARCGETKHTPWRAADGYVCVACLGKSDSERAAAERCAEEAERALEAMKDRDYAPLKVWIREHAPEAVRHAYALMESAESALSASREEAGRYREALAGVLAVADGDHCACGDPGCTKTREAWAAARAALSVDDGAERFGEGTR